MTILPPVPPLSPLILRRRRLIAVYQAAKAGDTAEVAKLLHNCREWDSLTLDDDEDVQSPDEEDWRLDHSVNRPCRCCLRDNWTAPARQTALIAAIKTGNIELATLLLDTGTLVFKPLGGRPKKICLDGCGAYLTFYDVAAKHGQVEILRLLFDRGFPFPKTERKRLADYALMTGNIEMTRLFVAEKVLKMSHAEFWSAYYGQVDLYKAMIADKIANPDSDDEHLWFREDDRILSVPHTYNEALIQYDYDQTPESHRQKKALKIFLYATTGAIAELGESLCEPGSITDEKRQEAFDHAISHSRACAIEYHMEKQNPPYRFDKSNWSHSFNRFSCSSVFPEGGRTPEKAHKFLVLCRLLGKENFTPRMACMALEHGYWSVFDEFIDQPDFVIGDQWKSDKLTEIMKLAIEEGQGRVLAYLLNHIQPTESLDVCTLFLDVFEKDYRPVVQPLRELAGGIWLQLWKEQLLETESFYNAQWMYVGLANWFLGLANDEQDSTETLEVIVGRVELPTALEAPVLASLRHIGDLVKQLITNKNKSKELKAVLQREIGKFRTIRAYTFIPKVIAEVVCTRALMSGQSLLYAIFRDALTGPSYPNQGHFFDNDGLKKQWLLEAIRAGDLDAVAYLAPTSPPKNVAAKRKRAPSKKVLVTLADEPLWVAAAEHAVKVGNTAILDILFKTQWSLKNKDGQKVSKRLLDIAFQANDRGLIKYLVAKGVDYSELDFCALVDFDDDANRNLATLEAIEDFLAASVTTQPQGSDTSSGDLNGDTALMNPMSHPTPPPPQPPSSELTPASCQGRPHIAANYTTLVFNSFGHALCGGCALQKYDLSELGRRKSKSYFRWKMRHRDRNNRRHEGENVDSDSYESESNSDNETEGTRKALRIACPKQYFSDNQTHFRDAMFPVTAQLKRMPADQELAFAKSDEACLLFSEDETFTQPGIQHDFEQGYGEYEDFDSFTTD